jgi:anti-anti-sigma factor
VKRQLLRDSETFHLEIPADENNLSEVRDFIAEVCLKAGFSKRETNNTKLAMDEACTNIIKHAYRDKAGTIRIDVQAEPGKVEINIFDRGIPFDWSKVKDPDLQQYVEIGKKGGLGIYLMNRLMDDLDYQASENGNRLFMVKHAGSTSSEPLFFSIKPKWTATLRFKFAFRATLGLLGLVLFLWIVQYVNQTRAVESQTRDAWLSMNSFARAIEAKSETAMIKDDLYDPEYRELTDFVIERVARHPAVEYVEIVNTDGIIVSSSDLDEFMNKYSIPPGAATMDHGGTWITKRAPDGEVIRELHFPIFITRDDEENVASLGRVIVGVSESVIMNSVDDPRLKTTLILAGIFVVGLALIYLLISVFVKPIQALTDGVRAIGEGALNDEIRIDGPEEIGEIARAFNEITQKFREAQHSVVEQERMQKEMQVAQEIQHSLLPGKVPDVSGYDIASLYRAAKEVGGDYYDFVSVDEDTLGVVVADVSGKGVPGSLVMTMIRTALRMEARGSHSAADVMSRMNDFVTEDMKKGMFVTIFYVILDSKNRVISYASAGHNPMVLFRAETDETFFLNPRGFPVGISLPDETLFRRSIDVEKIKLKKDDMLVIYTDGVTEAMNEDREQYGEDRLLALIKTCGKKSPDEFIDLLNEDIREFTGGYPQNDDITVVAVKEKLMADDVLYGIRKKLLDLVEVEGLSVAEACSRMKVSPSTYYRYKKRLTELGERGLRNKTLREEHEIKRVSLEQRKEILAIIRNDPKFGAKRIATAFNEGKDESDTLTPSLIYDELKRMRLNTYEKRLEYMRRNRFITEEQFQAMLAGEEVGAAGVSVAPAEKAGDMPVTGEEPVEIFEPPARVPEKGAPAGTDIPEFRPVTVSRLDGGEAEDDVERLLASVLGRNAVDGGLVEVLTQDEEKGIIVIRVSGHLDSSSAGELELLLESVHEYGFSKIVIDLGDVPYISSGGWGIFTGRVKMLREKEGDVVLAGMSPEVFDIYELLGFQDIIMHFRNVDEAVDFISLPFDVRQERLELVSGAASEGKRLEQRISAVVKKEEAEAEEEGAVPWSPLRIEAGTVGQSGEITILNLIGVIDTVSCMKLRDVLETLVGKGVTKFVVDMSLVEYVSSAGWGVFASRIDEVRRADGDIKIFGMDPEVDSIFHLLGFDVIMRSFSILSEAIEDYERAPAPAGPEAGVSTPVAAPDAAPAPENKTVSEATTGTGAESPRSMTASAVSGPRNLEFEVVARRSPDGRSMVLDVSGAIDAATSAALEDRLEEAIEGRPKFLVIDLSGVIYISSSGWGVIVKYMQKTIAWGGRMALSGMTQPIFKIFRDLGFEPLIPHFMSSGAALAELSAPAAESPVERSVGAPERAALAEEALEETPTPVDSFRADPLPEKKPAPSLEKAGFAPLEDTGRENAETLDVKLDLSDQAGDAEGKDGKIRRLGWSEYGKRLLERNSRRDGRKKKR